MKVEHPNALRFILQDEIYLLDEDKNNYKPGTSNPPQQHPDPGTEVETKQVNFNYLGANKKNFLVVVNCPEDEFMQKDHLVALESVLSRKGYNRDDVAILNIARHASAGHDQLTSFFEPKIMVLLGKGSIPAGMEPPQFNLPLNYSGISLLYTFSFDEMMTNNDNKKAFWEQMKAL